MDRVEQTKSYTNPFTMTATATTNLTILSEQLKNNDFDDAPKQSNNGNGYQQHMTYRPPAPQPIDDENIGAHLASKMHRLYTQSPQLPRRTYEFNSASGQVSQVPVPIQHHAPVNTNQSPYMPRKFTSDEADFGNHYSPYQPLPPTQQQIQQSTFSPVIRKRYQEGQLVAEDLEFRILHGNTSPIVLQRFYHQQNQLRDQKEEELRNSRMTNSSSPNPYRNVQQPSGIPIKSGSPLPLRYQPSPTLMHNRNAYHHPEPIYNASHHQNYELMQHHHHQQQHLQQLPHQQIQTKLANGNGSIPFHIHQQNLHHQKQPSIYDNLNHQRAPMPCPGSPQLDRLRMNLEKPNFYERHQKLPVEIESNYQMMERNASPAQQSNGVGSIGDKNKEKGEQSFCLNASLIILLPLHYFTILT